jgi:hypothetical protein
MPGGRLSHQERLAIGVGLSQGLGYAEIARQLSRPTSTVSRDVARNGGAADYHADRAHHATWQRARRKNGQGDGRPAAAPPDTAPPDTGAPGRDAEAIRQFGEEFAELMVRTGLPRMAARVFALLLITDSSSLTAAELVARLRVSAASVSKAVGYLEGQQVVQRVPPGPGQRRERYVVDEDVWFGAWSSSARSTVSWADTARRGAELLDAGTPAGSRLEVMAQFFARLGEDMSGGPVALPAAEDALTAVAALAHAATPLTVRQLADALEWPVRRVGGALEVAEQHPSITGPVAPCRSSDGASYTVTAAPDRLSVRQRARLMG